MGTLNREPQEYSRNIVEYKETGRYIFYYIPIFLGFPVWVPIKGKSTFIVHDLARSHSILKCSAALRRKLQTTSEL